MYLFVDDLRVPAQGFELSRTITDAIRKLSTEKVEVLSLDHDINLVPTVDGRSINVHSEETYATVARYVALMKKADQPKIIFLHTASYNGARDMERILTGTASRIVRVSPMAYEDEIWRFLDRQSRGKP